MDGSKMAVMRASASSLDDPILQRRRQLRRQRQLKLLQASWRSLAIAGLALGMLWAVSQPEWMLHQPSQVQIKGNRFITHQTLHSLLPLTYPQSLIRLQPKVLVATLEANAPIHKTVVTRQLFPPRLIIEVQERLPVATATCDVGATNTPASPSCILMGRSSPSPPLVQGPATVWLIDSQGIPLPLESFSGLQASNKLPQLQVLGLFQAKKQSQDQNLQSDELPAAHPRVILDPQKQAQWQTLYSVLSRSPVNISEVDWRQHNNLILKTELGVIHLGPYDASKFAAQLQALDQMRQWPKYLNASQVAYIDLENPDHPLTQLQTSKNGKGSLSSDKNLP